MLWSIYIFVIVTNVTRELAKDEMYSKGLS